MFFGVTGVTKREVDKKGEKKGKWVEGKFSLRIVCQNHISLPSAYCLIPEAHT